MTHPASTRATLDARNYAKGMLIDDEWMAGISKDQAGFSLFVVNHIDGEALFHRTFLSLEEALDAVNQIPRPWRYESTGGCSGERCGEGNCKGEGCKIYVPPKNGSSPQTQACGG
jgi:hypothetical protein